MENKGKKLHEFSLRLKRARTAMGWSQRDLAEQSGVCLKTIKRLEGVKAGDKERSPLAINLLHLAQALDVTPEYLLLGDENMDIYMEAIKKELLALDIKQIRHYHGLPLTDKVLSHLKLTDEFIGEIQRYWKQNTISCYFPYVMDTIIKYCHHRPKRALTITEDKDA